MLAEVPAANVPASAAGAVALSVTITVKVFVEGFASAPAPAVIVASPPAATAHVTPAIGVLSTQVIDVPVNPVACTVEIRPPAAEPSVVLLTFEGVATNRAMVSSKLMEPVTP